MQLPPVVVIALLSVSVSGSNCEKSGRESDKEKPLRQEDARPLSQIFHWTKNRVVGADLSC